MSRDSLDTIEIRVSPFVEVERAEPTTAARPRSSEYPTVRLDLSPADLERLRAAAESL